MKKRLSAVLFGPQGCGKGTQGELLCERFSLPLIGSGELLRAEIEEGTAMGNLVKKYVELGMLAPDELVNAIMLRQLKLQNLDNGFLLDGYPRNVEQAEALDRFNKINLAIQLKIRDDEAVRRLLGRRQCKVCRTIFNLQNAPPVQEGICTLCGGKLMSREDDEEDLIRHRLAVYHFMTEPLATYYRRRGVLLTVNGEQPISSLFQELVRKLGKLGFVA